jgi:hypothetical protein
MSTKKKKEFYFAIENQSSEPDITKFRESGTILVEESEGDAIWAAKNDCLQTIGADTELAPGEDHDYASVYYICKVVKVIKPIVKKTIKMDHKEVQP